MILIINISYMLDLGQKKGSQVLLAHQATNLFSDEKRRIDRFLLMVIKWEDFFFKKLLVF